MQRVKNVATYTNIQLFKTYITGYVHGQALAGVDEQCYL